MGNCGGAGFGMRYSGPSSGDGISRSVSNTVAWEKAVLRAAAPLDLRLDLFLALPLLLVGWGSIVTALRLRETPSEPESLLSGFSNFVLAISSTGLDISGYFKVFSDTPPVSGAVTYSSSSDPGPIFS